MNILLVSTLKRRVAADEFASRTRIIFQLGRELAKRGHTVKLLGTADSLIPGVATIPVIEKPWIDSTPVENEFQRDVAELMLLAKAILREQESVDVIHNHTYPDLFPSIVEDQLTVPLVTTLHVVHDYYVDNVLEQFPKTRYITLSDAYRNKVKKGNVYKTVYNGIDTELFKYKETKGDYLFWLGRLPKSKNKDGTFMDPKGVRWAIQLAQKTGNRLFISAPVEDKNFFEQDIKPHLNDRIQFVGEPTSEQSVPLEKIIDLYQNAKAFLMTINQEEPFGLVTAEAMSCGTPVIGFDRGSIPEIVQNGKTGFLVTPSKGIDGLIEAVSKIDSIKPADCRQHAVERFSIERMVSDYENVYHEVSDQPV